MSKEDVKFSVFIVLVALVFIASLVLHLQHATDKARETCEDAGGAYVSNNKCEMPGRLP